MQNPLLHLHMASGNTITIELFPSITPNSVASVMYLAQKGYYNGRDFYRVVKDFVIQADCDVRNGYITGCDYIIDGEYKESGFLTEQPKFAKYMVGLAGMGKDSNISSGSAFFIMTGPYDTLDGNFAVIGQVISGFDEVDRINNVVCNLKYYGEIPFYTPKEKQVILKATVETFGITYPEPVVKEPTGDYLEKEKELNELIERDS